MQRQSPQHSPQHNLALYTLLDDMRRFGVTSTLSAEARGVDQDFAPTKAVQQNIVQQPRKVADTQAPSKPTPQKTKTKQGELPKKKAPRPGFSADTFIQTRKGTLPFTVVMAIEDGQAEPLTFNDTAEETLWKNMMTAVDVRPEAENFPSYVMITGDAAIESNLRDDEEEALAKALFGALGKEAGAHKAVLAVGKRARKLMLAGSGADVDKSADGETLELKKGCNLPLLTIYQLQAMLRQPTLKRQTWATLLKLREALS